MSPHQSRETRNDTACGATGDRCLLLRGGAGNGRSATWTDVSGRTMQAEFIREVDGDATFLKDGKLITIPLQRLSDDDQKRIREIEAGERRPSASGPARNATVDPPFAPGSDSQPPSTDAIGPPRPTSRRGAQKSPRRPWSVHGPI